MSGYFQKKKIEEKSKIIYEIFRRFYSSFDFKKRD